MGLNICLGYYALCAYHMHLYLTVIMPILLRRYDYKAVFAWTTLLVYLMFMACSNHFLAAIIKPGSPRCL